VQSGGSLEVVARLLVDQTEKSPRTGELSDVRASQPAQDPQDLDVLAPLKHRHRHQQSEQRSTVAAGELVAIDSERANSSAVVEHLGHARIGGRSVVTTEVPPDDRSRHANLTRGR
jgi:hypothetical protein